VIGGLCAPPALAAGRYFSTLDTLMSEKMTTESSDPGRRDDGEREANWDDEKGGAAGDPGEGEVSEAEVLGAEPSAEDRVAQLEAQAADLKDKWIRAAADLENYRRRTRREVDDARADGIKRTLAELLPVVDNLERALQHAETATSEEAKGIADGVKLVTRQFSQALERLNVQVVEAEGKPFDPAVHEAMSQMETSEVPPGTVAQVLQRGYKLGDRLLRPALVVVAKAAPEAEQGAGQRGTSPGDDV
jgi:molecular chaperone GrpE